MEQIEAQEQATQEWTFRDYVDVAIVFGCIPGLILTVIFWAIATAFPGAGVLPALLALLITFLLALMGIVLLVRYVDVCAINGRAYNAAPYASSSDTSLMLSAGAGIVCLFLAASIVACLSTAGRLESWHYTLMAAEVLLVGYQTWRTFLGKR